MNRAFVSIRVAVAEKAVTDSGQAVLVKLNICRTAGKVITNLKDFPLFPWQFSRVEHRYIMIGPFGFEPAHTKVKRSVRADGKGRIKTELEVQIVKLFCRPGSSLVLSDDLRAFVGTVIIDDNRKSQLIHCDITHQSHIGRRGIKRENVP